jgi:putative redox protein
MAGRSPEVRVRWREDVLFEGAAPGRPPILVDGNSVAAASPIELLLVAAATCTAADVVSILAKQRVALQALEVVVLGTRREEQPRRFTALQFHFTIAGAGADATKARRAIDLSLEKYCSVVASLAPDISVTYDVTLG